VSSPQVHETEGVKARNRGVEKGARDGADTLKIEHDTIIRRQAITDKPVQDGAFAAVDANGSEEVRYFDCGHWDRSGSASPKRINGRHHEHSNESEGAY
jgi:hypothetical protein